jgi:hypothetical protein
VGAELERLPACVFEFGAHVGVDQVAGLDAFEAVPFESGCVLCLQQSAGNSAGPEVDVTFAFLADGLLDRHVGDLDPAAGLQHAEDL